MDRRKKYIDKGKWIRFVLIKGGDKTNVWRVVTKDLWDSLGEIKWFSRWRQYAFFPFAGTIFEKTCLGDIANFMEEKMLARKNKERAK